MSSNTQKRMNYGADTGLKKQVRALRTEAPNKAQHFGDSDTNDVYALERGCGNLSH